MIFEPYLEKHPYLSDDVVWPGVAAVMDIVEGEMSGAESLLVDRLYVRA
jgi:hypothetical protein